MNHITQYQLSNGKWIMASLNRRGSYIVCGCVNEQGHDTAEDAQLHYYNHCLQSMTLDRNLRTATQAGECVVCKTDLDKTTWTPRFVNGDFYGRFGGLHEWLCDEHIPADDEALRQFVQKVSPFEPNYEGWNS